MYLHRQTLFGSSHERQYQVDKVRDGAGMTGRTHEQTMLLLGAGQQLLGQTTKSVFRTAPISAFTFLLGSPVSHSYVRRGGPLV